MNVEIKDAGDARKIVNVTFDSDEMSSKGKEVCRNLAEWPTFQVFEKVKPLNKLSEKDLPKKYNRN